MVYKAKKPKYYIRMFKDGRWFFLWKLTYDKKKNVMNPIWWDEAARGESKPYLYKTLVGARNSLDRFKPLQAVKVDVAVWSEVDGILQTESYPT